MPRKQRMYRHGETYFVSNRTARGLPFVPNEYMNMLIGGILARATNLYPGATVSDWLFMGNHYHAIITITGCAENFRYFMNYVDGEIGKIINRLLGVTNQNVWAGEFEARPLLTAQAIIDKTIYLYCNPAKANLVESVYDFPGISTWRQFEGKPLNQYKRINPSEVTKLPNTGFSKSLLRNLMAELESLQRKPLVFYVEPCAWLNYIPDATKLTKEEVTLHIKAKVLNEEASSRAERRKKQRAVVCAEALSAQSIYKYYRPKAWRKSTACISTCKELARQYLKLYRDFCTSCQFAWQEWKSGNLLAKYPPGAFLPPRNPLSSIWF